MQYIQFMQYFIDYTMKYASRGGHMDIVQLMLHPDPNNPNIGPEAKIPVSNEKTFPNEIKCLIGERGDV